MHTCKRIRWILTALIGLVAVGVLVMSYYNCCNINYWLGFYPWLNTALLIATAIIGFHLFCMLFVGLFYREKREIILSRDDGGVLTVTKSAIASYTEHLVEEQGLFETDHIHVEFKGKKKVRVWVRVVPLYACDLSEVGQALHTHVYTGLARVCGAALSEVNFKFLESKSYEPVVTSQVASAYASTPTPAPVPTPASEYADDSDVSHASAVQTESNVEVPTSSDATLETASKDITLPMYRHDTPLH